MLMNMRMSVSGQVVVGSQCNKMCMFGAGGGSAFWGWDVCEGVSVFV